MAPTTLLPPPVKTSHRKGLWLGAAALALLLIMGVLWRLWDRGDTNRTGPAQERAQVSGEFRSDLRQNPIPRPPGDKPMRRAFRAWLAERGIEYSQERGPDATSRPKDSLPTVIDMASAPRPTAPPAPERIEPSQTLSEDELHHPEIFFEMAKSVPEYSRLEERRDALDFFESYRTQLKGDLDRQIQEGAKPDMVAETRAAIGRYDEAIGKLQGLIQEQEKVDQGASQSGP